MLYSTRELGASWNLIEKITCEEGFVASRTGQSVARVRLHVGQPCHLQGAEQILRLQGLIRPAYPLIETLVASCAGEWLNSTVKQGMAL